MCSSDLGTPWARRIERTRGYLQQAVKRKEYALHKAVPPEHWVGVPYNEDEANAFLNLNTPDDLARVRLLLESFIVDCCSQKNMQMHQVASLK